ncbi:UNVERIFIED_CONTAM: hypothetical protein PYX00_010215 [Menopon gallinae]|uniref:Kelch domain-containing protein 3 n=1 Tax=Menopon gallinae TaxID=328185 RepID=A0AAW2HEN5_9NEOP
MALVWTTNLRGGPQKVNHAAALVGKSIYSFGGYCTQNLTVKLIDVYVLCTVTNRWKALDDPTDPIELACVPFQRYGHTAVAHGTKIYIWGGKNETLACNRLYCFDTVLQKWSCPHVEGPIPSARDGHTACIIDNKMYILGGFADDFARYADGLYALDLITMTWSHIDAEGEAPSYRDFHSAAAVNGKMYVFGGRGGVNGPFYTQRETYNNDMYIFDPKTQFWSKKSSPNAPIGRRSLGMVPHGNGLYIFGGYNGVEKNYYNDVYYYDTTTDEWSAEIQTYGAKPCKRRRHCTVIVNNQIYIFGGTSPIDSNNKEIEDSYSDSNYFEDRYLINFDDLYILDLQPTLRTLCMLAVIKHKLDIICLPKILQRDILRMTIHNSIRPRKSRSGRSS